MAYSPATIRRAEQILGYGIKADSRRTESVLYNKSYKGLQRPCCKN